MELNEYQARAQKTAVYPNQNYNIPYVLFGLLGEAGELANKYKKVLRDNNGELNPEKRTEMFNELGDVLWYVAMLATELGYTLDEVAVANVYKLQQRQQQNKLQGSGDNR